MNVINQDTGSPATGTPGQDQPQQPQEAPQAPASEPQEPTSPQEGGGQPGGDAPQGN